MRFDEDLLKHIVEPNGHYSVLTRLRKKLNAVILHLVMRKHNLILDEAVNPLEHGGLNLLQAHIVNLALHQSVHLLKRVQCALVQALAFPDECSSGVPFLLQLVHLRSGHWRVCRAHLLLHKITHLAFLFGLCIASCNTIFGQELFQR